MQRIFEKWLLIYTIVASIIAFGLSYHFETIQSLRSTRELVGRKISDTRKILELNAVDIQKISDFFDNELSSQAKTAAQMIQYYPELLRHPEQIKAFLNTFCAEEIHVSDEKGVLFCSYPSSPEFDKFNISQDRGFAVAVELLHGKESNAGPRFFIREGVNKKPVLYVAIPRQDQSGIVLVGVCLEARERLLNLAKIDKYSSAFSFGSLGRIIVCRNSVVIGTINKEFIGKKYFELGLKLSPKKGKYQYFTSNSGEKKASLSEIFDDIQIFAVLPESELFINRNSFAFGLISFHIVLFIIANALMVLLVRRVIIKGIYKVNRSLNKITGGDLEEQVEVRTNPEMCLLSDGINQTVDALRRSIAETAARIDKDLEMGRNIQRATLPSIFPAFPDRQEFDVFATMKTAKEVGGDFYDFFLIDDRHLCVVMADVSGKGIPAALFMMTVKTMFQDVVQSQKMSLAAACTKSNNQLLAKNDTGMFVTLFAAVLDIDSGQLTCISAGHNPAILVRNNSPAEWLQPNGGPMLAVIDGLEYTQSVIQMEPGDILYLYTDGVTEAFSANEDIYGDDRLLNLFASPKMREMSLQEILLFIQNDLDQFTAGARQSDDITMLALKYYGK